MARRPHPKRLAKAQEQFKAAVTTYLESIGTRPSDFYDLELDTPAGLYALPSMKTGSQADSMT